MGELADSAYEALARQRVEALSTAHGVEAAIFEGGIRSIAYVTERIEALCDGPDASESGGSLSRYVEMLEGMTGLSAVDTFDDELTPNCARIRAMVSQFERSGGATRFEAGERYFFGHRLAS